MEQSAEETLQGGVLVVGFNRTWSRLDGDRTRSERVAAVRADLHRLGDAPASGVAHLQRRSVGGGPSVAPLAHRGEDVPEIASLLGEPIARARWIVLVSHALENAVVDQLRQALIEDVARDTESRLEVIEPAYTQERVAHDQQAPP